MKTWTCTGRSEVYRCREREREKKKWGRREKGGREKESRGRGKREVGIFDFSILVCMY